MRLLWKYIRNYFLVYQLISHFLFYLQNYKEFEAEILDLQSEKYGLSFDIKKYTTSGWALGDENVIGIRAFKCNLLKNIEVQKELHIMTTQLAWLHHKLIPAVSVTYLPSTLKDKFVVRKFCSSDTETSKDSSNCHWCSAWKGRSKLYITIFILWTKDLEDSQYMNKDYYNYNNHFRYYVCLSTIDQMMATLKKQHNWLWTR